VTPPVPPVAVESPYVAQLIEWLAKMTRRKWEKEGRPE
jgi:hypothetical protein